IEDLKSSNGTFIEGSRVQRQYLKNGDTIVLGAGTKLKFTIS
ncbi:MAG: FHA domain-containing protein, partial [Myxococcales bacterium]|nr:FHA domain-containing protein [Myxococcales bacterium]